jgi:Na+/H+ antiporter NhaC
MIENNPLLGFAHWTSVLPALLAIAMALTFRQVLVSLFAGVWLGTLLLTEFHAGAILTSFLAAMTDFVVPAVANPDHASILIFTLLIGGMVGIITDNGSTSGIVRSLMRFVKTRVQAQLATVGLGAAIFFNDYATAIVVGNTARPLTDRLRISRAKLAYLVDSMAAPVAIIAPVSTWIGAMVAFIAAATISMEAFDVAPYTVFLQSVPYNFYAVFTVFFAVTVAGTGRDFGPMLRSALHPNVIEQHAESLPGPPDEIGIGPGTIRKPSHWAIAALPILVLVLGTVIGLLVTGDGSTIRELFATADSYTALLWSSLLSLTTAMILTLVLRLMSLGKMMESMTRGMFVMFGGLIILVLAWSLSAVTRDLGAAEYLVGVFGTALDPFWVPSIAFVLASMMSFATGSSWGTMGILMPLALPLVWSFGPEMNLPLEVAHTLVFSTTGAVMAGSVFGDHSSPISDTTILSSLGADCDHVEHTNTQLAYAAVCGALALAGLVVVKLTGAEWWVIHLLGLGATVGVIYAFGKTPLPESLGRGLVSPTASTSTSGSPG